MQCTTLQATQASLKRSLFHLSWSTTRFYRLSHSEIVDIEKVAVRSSLQSPNNKTLGWILEEIHVTWAHLEKKRTKLQTYTKSHDDFCKQWLETTSCLAVDNFDVLCGVSYMAWIPISAATQFGGVTDWYQEPRLAFNKPVIHADILVLSSEVPVIPPITLEAEAAVVALPAGVLDMIIHSYSESDPSEDPSLPEHAPIVPSTSPLLFLDSFETFGDYSDSDSSERPPSHDPCESSVTTRMEESSHTLSCLAPHILCITHPFRDTKALVTEISPVPHVVCHRTHMTARKGVTGLRPVMTPARSTALRLSRAHPSSHSSGSSPSSSSSSSNSSSSSSGSSSEGSSFDTLASSPERLSCLSATHSHSGTLPCRWPQGSDYVTHLPSPSTGLS
ncbi:hypothetical protein Tco_0287157 [Tanacetum coccineum]